MNRYLMFPAASPNVLEKFITFPFRRFFFRDASTGIDCFLFIVLILKRIGPLLCALSSQVCAPAPPHPPALNRSETKAFPPPALVRLAGICRHTEMSADNPLGLLFSLVQNKFLILPPPIGRKLSSINEFFLIYYIYLKCADPKQENRPPPGESAGVQIMAVSILFIYLPSQSFYPALSLETLPDYSLRILYQCP